MGVARGLLIQLLTILSISLQGKLFPPVSPLFLHQEKMKLFLASPLSPLSSDVFHTNPFVLSAAHGPHDLQGTETLHETIF